MGRAIIVPTLSRPSVPASSIGLPHLCLSVSIRGCFFFPLTPSPRLLDTVQSGERGDVQEQLAHVEAGLNKRLAQVVQNMRTISEDRLLDKLMKQLLDEGVLRLFTPGGEFGQVTRPRQSDGLAVIGGVIARRIN